MPNYTPENTVGLGRPVKVFLNGHEVKDVVEADTDHGYIVQVTRDEDGKRVLHGDEMATHHLYGVVEVKNAAA